MISLPEGNAVVYCEGAFNTPNGKTAHGLVRHTRRYKVRAIVDSNHKGKDAGEVLDGKRIEIPILASVAEACGAVAALRHPPNYFVVGLAPDGGRMNGTARADVREAISRGFHVDSGLHDYLSEDPGMVRLAQDNGVRIRDVRKPPHRDKLHFFSGKIEEVKSLKIALLGTDSAVGKRTTALLLVQGAQNAGLSAEMVGTGQTAWLQGARYCIILDSLVNDFISGEIEHAVWSCWKELNPEVIVVEGQGSLMNPAYPGGFEILAAARPDIVIMQHAPVRKDYDGFPGYPIHPLRRQIEAVEILSGKPVVAITVNHEGLASQDVPRVCEEISQETGLPAFDVLLDGAAGLVETVRRHLK